MAEYEKLPRQKKTLNGRSHKTEISDDFERSAAFETILTLAGSAANVAPPPDFTRKVMHRLSETGTGARRTSGAPSLGDRLKMSFGYLTRPASVVEVATCFFLTGFFYLVLGICFHLGLKSLAVAPSAAGWLYLSTAHRRADRHGLHNGGLFIVEKKSPGISNRQSGDNLLYFIFDYQRHAGSGNPGESPQLYRRALLLRRFDNNRLFSGRDRK